MLRLTAPALQLVFRAARANIWYWVFGRSPVNIGLVRQPLDGVDVDLPIAYSTCWLPGFKGTVKVLAVMLLCVTVLAFTVTVGGPLTAAPALLLTTNLTLNLAENGVPPSVPLTVTVALCVPTLIPVLGTTVNVAGAPAATLPSVVADNVKLAA